MNEKEARERKLFLDWTEQHEDFGLSYKQIADWWLARIHDRDERLKELVKHHYWDSLEKDKDIIIAHLSALIDNHDPQS